MNEIAHPIPKFLTNTSEICLALITTFIASWLLGHGVSLTTSIGFCLLFTCQCIIGAQTWSWLCNQQKRPMFESISVGYVIGSTLTTIADQVLINWGHRYLYLRIGIGVCTILIILNRGRHPNFKPISTNLYQNFSLLFFIFCFVVAGGHPLVKSWFFVFCICLFMGTLLAIRAKPIMEFSIIAISFMIIVSFGFVHYLWRPSLKYGPDLLFPLFSGTDDFIHSEATANSLIHFGPWNSIAAPGYRTAYHWFSLALSGNIKGFLNAEPFVVTLHIAPLIGLLIISMLVVSVIYSISESITASIIALFIAFLTTTIPIGARTIQNLNTTNLISYFWSLSAVLTCLLFLKKSIRFGVFIITIFASLSFLSKTPHGVIVYIGIVGMLVVGLTTKRLVHRTILELMSSLTFSYICIYWFFLNPMPWQDRGFDYPLNSTRISVGSPFYPLVPIGVVAVFALMRFPVFSLSLWKQYNLLQKIFIGLILFGSFSSLIRFVIAGATAEVYFLNMGLMLSSLGFGCYFAVLLSTTSQYFMKVLLLQFIVTSVVFLSVLKIEGDVGLSVSIIVLPFFGIVATTVIFLLFSRVRDSGTLSIVVCSLLSVGSIGISFSSYLNTAFSVPSAAFTSDILPLDELDGLNFLRSISSFNDVIATNRNLCPVGLHCNQDETLQIVSAFTNRAVLIEGPRFLNGARNYPAWAEERIDLSIDFAMNPTEVGKDKLLNFGVKWFYLVKNTPGGPTNSHKIESLSKLVFENATIAIYDLSPQS